MDISDRLKKISEILINEKYTDVEKMSAIKGIVHPDFFKNRILKYSLFEISKQIEKLTGITVEQMHKYNRSKYEVVFARQLAHYKAIKFNQVPLEVIGEYFGGKDHASVMHSKKLISNLLEVDKKFKLEYEEFLNN